MRRVFKSLEKWQLVAAILALTAFGLPTGANATALSSVEIDELVARTMETFDVPGIAIGIIKDGEVIHAKGYGVREVGKKGKVDPKTLFAIASTGKSMTTTALALLVDEGKITWDNKVIDYIPDFRLYDPWVTREFTIKDLLIHNSGLGLGAGDLMMFPSPAFSRGEIIANLRHLKPVSSFRSEYAYDNLLYIVAGEVIAAVSGMPYEQFIDERIFKPLKMENCSADLVNLADYKNIASPHMVRDGVLQTTEPDVTVGERNIFAAAGGILCSVKSILKWHDMQLSKGKLPGGDVFLSEQEQTEIMTPQTITPVNSLSREWFGTNFSAYGLGWSLSDAFGAKIEQHSGGLLGMLSINAMVPDLGLGIAIYTNQQAGYARPAILYSILESYLTDRSTDWVARFYEFKQDRIAEAAKVVPNLTDVAFSVHGSLERYVGTYRDPWFEDIEIKLSEDGLYFASVRSERLRGKMVPFKQDLFIVQWDDRTLDADAYVRFSPDFDGQPEGITMKAVSPLTDFSFDFHDLDFVRVEQEVSPRLLKIVLADAGNGVARTPAFGTQRKPESTLTIVALAIRQADHIADRMAKGELLGARLMSANGLQHILVFISREKDNQGKLWRVVAVFERIPHPRTLIEPEPEIQ